MPGAAEEMPARAMSESASAQTLIAGARARANCLTIRAPRCEVATFRQIVDHPL